MSQSVECYPQYHVFLTIKEGNKASAPARTVESISGWKKDLPTKLIKIVVHEILVGVLQIFINGESIQYRKKKIVKMYVLAETCLGMSYNLCSSVFVTIECFHCIFMIHDIQGKTVNMVCWPNFLGDKKTRVWKKKFSLLKIAVFFWNIS